MKRQCSLQAYGALTLLLVLVCFLTAACDEDGYQPIPIISSDKEELTFTVNIPTRIQNEDYRVTWEIDEPVTVSIYDKENDEYNEVKKPNGDPASTKDITETTTFYMDSTTLSADELFTVTITIEELIFDEADLSYKPVPYDPEIKREITFKYIEKPEEE